MLAKGQISTIFFNNSGSFNYKDFGDNLAMVQWYAFNTGSSDVVLFNGQYRLASGQSSPVFAMNTGFADYGNYFFQFNSKGENGLLIVASLVYEAQ